MENDYARFANEYQTVWLNSVLIGILEADRDASLERVEALLLAIERCLTYLDAIESRSSDPIPYLPVYPQNGFPTGLPS